MNIPATLGILIGTLITVGCAAMVIAIGGQAENEGVKGYLKHSYGILLGLVPGTLLGGSTYLIAKAFIG